LSPTPTPTNTLTPTPTLTPTQICYGKSVSVSGTNISYPNATPQPTTTVSFPARNCLVTGTTTFGAIASIFSPVSNKLLTDCINPVSYIVSEYIPYSTGTTFNATIDGVSVCVTYSNNVFASPINVLNSIDSGNLFECRFCAPIPSQTPTTTVTVTPSITPTITSTPTTTSCLNTLIDYSFNGGLGLSGGTVYDSVILSDGRTVIAGDFTTYRSSTPLSPIFIINDNGSIDATFSVSTSSMTSTITSICVDEINQSIYCNSGPGYITKLNFNGTVDSTFETNKGTGFDAQPSKLKLINTTSGYTDIFAVGNISNYNNDTPYFNYAIPISSLGEVSSNFSALTIFDNIIRDVEVDSNDDLILVGDFTSYNFNSSVGIVKIDKYGNFVNSFSGASIGFNTSVNKVLIDSNDNIYCFGNFTTYSGTFSNEIVKLTTNGLLSQNFTCVNTNNNIVTAKFNVDQNKIYVGGDFSGSAISSYGFGNLVAINTNNSIDYSFATIPGFNLQVTNLNVKNNDRILVFGDFTSYNSFSPLYGITQLYPCQIPVTPSVTPSNSATPTITPTISVTASVTASNTLTPTNTPTNTQTPSQTATNSPTPSITKTNTQTKTSTLTPSNTSTNTATPSQTATNTPTPSVTKTQTPTNSITPSITPTIPCYFTSYNNGAYAGRFSLTGGTSSALPLTVFCNQVFSISSNAYASWDILGHTLVSGQTYHVEAQFDTINTNPNIYFEFWFGSDTYYPGVSGVTGHWEIQPDSTSVKQTNLVWNPSGVTNPDIYFRLKNSLGSQVSGYSGNVRFNFALVNSSCFATPTPTNTSTPTTTPSNTLTPTITSTPTSTLPYCGISLDSVTYVSGTTYQFNWTNYVPTCSAVNIQRSPDNGLNWYGSTGSCTSPRNLDFGILFDGWWFRVEQYCPAGSSISNVLIPEFNYSAGTIATSVWTGDTSPTVIYNILSVSGDNYYLTGSFSDFRGNSSTGAVVLNRFGDFDSSISGPNSDVYSSAYYTGNTIISSGYFTTWDGTSAVYVEVNDGPPSYNANGSTFQSPYTFDGSDVVFKVIPLSDGKILAEFNNNTGNSIVKHNINGSFDGGFLTGATNSGGALSNFTISNDESQILLIGNAMTSYSGVSCNNIIALTSGGSIDNSFVYGTGFDALANVAITTSSNKYLIGGMFGNYNGTTVDNLVMLDIDGSVDTSFSGRTFSAGTYVSHIKELSDGRFAVFGDFDGYDGYSARDFIVINTDGSLDTSVTYFTVGTDSTNYVLDSIEDGNGLICVGFFNSVNGYTRRGTFKVYL